MKGLIILRMCLITVETMTFAVKARRALNARGIDAEITSVDPALTKKGCAYGIKTDCESVVRAAELLDAKGISYGGIIGR